MKFEYDEFINSINDLSDDEKLTRSQSAVFNAENLMRTKYIGKTRKNNPEEVGQILSFISRLKSYINSSFY